MVPEHIKGRCKEPRPEALPYVKAVQAPGHSHPGFLGHIEGCVSIRHSPLEREDELASVALYQGTEGSSVAPLGLAHEGSLLSRRAQLGGARGG